MHDRPCKRAGRTEAICSAVASTGLVSALAFAFGSMRTQVVHRSGEGWHLASGPFEQSELLFDTAALMPCHSGTGDSPSFLTRNMTGLVSMAERPCSPPLGATYGVSCTLRSAIEVPAGQAALSAAKLDCWV